MLITRGPSLMGMAFLSERQCSGYEEYWQWETASIYITLCTTCGLLMGAKNRLFWENRLTCPMCDKHGQISVGVNRNSIYLCIFQRVGWKWLCINVSARWVCSGSQYGKVIHDNDVKTKKWCHSIPTRDSRWSHVFWTEGTGEIKNKQDLD